MCHFILGASVPFCDYGNSFSRNALNAASLCAHFSMNFPIPYRDCELLGFGDVMINLGIYSEIFIWGSSELSK